MDEKNDKIENDPIQKDIEKKQLDTEDHQKKISKIKQKEKKENKETLDEEYNEKLARTSNKKISTKEDNEDDDKPISPKKKFVVNLVKFIIGLILLFMCFQYLDSHPAEKTSMVSGLQTIYERFSIFVQGIVTWETDALNDKYKLEQAYQELINTIKNSACNIDDTTKQWLNTKYSELKALNIKTYKTKQQDYYDYFVVFNQLLKQKCN